MYKYYLTQRGVAPGCQPKGFVSFADELAELTNGKRSYGWVGYDKPLTDEQIRDYELVPHSDTVRPREYKFFKGWHESGIRCYEDYAKPGDIVDQETIDYFLNTVPPHKFGKDYLQYGEPWSFATDDRGRCRDTWTTFYRKDYEWYYAGHCFSGQIKHQG